jgi:hypothetical protein
MTQSGHSVLEDCCHAIRFNGSETVADVPVAGHEMYSQAILGCRDFQLDFLGWTDNVSCS